MRFDRSQARWITTSFIVYFFAAEGFTKACFGQINDTTTKFFKVHVETVDWFTLTSSVSCGLVLFLMTFPASCKRFKIRKAALVSTVSLVCSFIFLVSAWLIHIKNSFIFVIMGQMFSGAVNATNWIVTGAVAATWFSQERLLRIIALVQAGRDLGHLVGFLIPSSTLSTVSSFPTGNASTALKATEKISWSSEVSLAMATTFSSVLAANVLLGFSCFVLVYDPPPLDSRNDGEYRRPTVHRISDVEVSNEDSHQSQVNSTKFFKLWEILRKNAYERIPAWYHATKYISKNWRFVVLVLSFSAIEAMNITWFILISDMMSAVSAPSIYTAADASKLPGLNTHQPASITKPELAMALLCFGSMVSGLLTSKALRDITSKSYRSLVYVLLAGASGMTLIVIALFVYFYMLFNWCNAILIFMPAYGIFMSMTRTMIFAMILRNFSDVNSSLLICWMNWYSSMIGFLLPLCGRQIFNMFGAFGVMVFQLIQAAVVLLSLLFV